MQTIAVTLTDDPSKQVYVQFVKLLGLDGADEVQLSMIKTPGEPDIPADQISVC